MTLSSHPSVSSMLTVLGKIFNAPIGRLNAHSLARALVRLFRIKGEHHVSQYLPSINIPSPLKQRHPCDLHIQIYKVQLSSCIVHDGAVANNNVEQRSHGSASPELACVALHQSSEELHWENPVPHFLKTITIN